LPEAFSTNSVVAIDEAAVSETLRCGKFVVPRGRARPSGPRRRIHELTAEAVEETLGVRRSYLTHPASVLVWVTAKERLVKGADFYLERLKGHLKQ